MRVRSINHEGIGVLQQYMYARFPALDYDISATNKH